ncbi:cell wall-associated NlpC family hydrolase [Catenuloplanes nepalensis]|uniref:Cell wall-associated NlpC family hydrolase n=1 Tax=Catenuloplanes nepalensis TaxID=587533 RepID=A0ABT9N514_9ACTN|nr:C40 family peptidase [Catenuloplanes nepalensis]MDP9798787.1 cell wall-associated NlpC family hydrolase [Catenuloplanes nepalensis]
MPRTDLGGITHVPTTRRALTGVLVLTVAGIAAAGPAHDSHAADERPTAAAASSTAERDSVTGAVPDDRPVRLIGLRTGIHPRPATAEGDEVHAGPAGAPRALERTARRAAPRSASAAPRSASAAPRSARVARPSLTRRTGIYQKQRVRAEARRYAGDARKRSDRWHDARDRRASKAAKVKYGKAKHRKARNAYRPDRRYTGELGRVVEYALNQVGKPYRRNAAGPGSYDCSGLVSVAYRKAGVKLPHSSRDIVRKGRKVRRADLRPGDVVMPQSGHVGIYLGDGKMVHAATPRKGVVVSKMYGFSTARRLL